MAVVGPIAECQLLAWDTAKADQPHPILCSRRFANAVANATKLGCANER